VNMLTVFGETGQSKDKTPTKKPDAIEAEGPILDA